ncbi:MAG: hypothetical protein IPN38_13115 [Flavobacteriales bacterium]|nr:hypothetical protein [Flavobacteriales bacterium]
MACFFMWDEEQLMEQVEAYAEDRLTGPDRAAFEKRMASTHILPTMCAITD